MAQPNSRKEESSVANNKQLQKAGANSEQYQVTNMTVYNGITEERARAIYSEMNAKAMREYTEDANKAAFERMSKLEERLMEKMQKVESLLPAFSDPAFQIALKHAQITAAATEREADYEILAELLASHAENKQDRKKRTGLIKAIEIIDDLDEQALCALTVYCAFLSIPPVSSNATEGIAELNKEYQQLMYMQLPTELSWLDHLDILGAIRTSTLSVSRMFEDHIDKIFDGYICLGIKQGSSEQEMANRILQSVCLSPTILVSNELAPGYLRIPLSTKRHLNIALIENRPIMDIEKHAIEHVWSLYSMNPLELDNIKRVFIAKWDEQPALKQFHMWFNKIQRSIELTEIGNVICTANIKQHTSEIAVRYP